MNYRYLRLAIALASLLGASVLDCKGGGRPQVLPDTDTTPPGTGGGGRGGTGGSSQSGGSSGTKGEDAGVEDAGFDAAGANCGVSTCRGAGQCAVVDGKPRCVCDPGYTLVDTECVVDEQCIQLRRLENGCRLRLETEPAVAMFFMLETCAGTTVRPEILGDPSQAFKVTEDDLDLGEESYATVLDRDVESLVMVALDLSESVASDPNQVVPLIGEIQNFVNAIEPAPGAPTVKVGLIVFGRSVHIIREMTTDFDQIRADLAALAADPEGVVSEPGGTNLIGAVNTGVIAIQNYQNANFQDGDQLGNGDLGSILKVGTVVVVTDGRDTSGSQLNPQSTVVNRVSIGISSDIDDVELSRVGPQGSFLAPTPADWTQAFQRVAERVQEFPQRTYLLSYCSPAVAATHRVVVTLAEHQTSADAVCTFDATTFGVGIGSCNAQFVSNYCDTRTCGSFLACRPCLPPDGGTPEQALDDRWIFGPR